MAMTDAKLLAAFDACYQMLFGLGEWVPIRNGEAAPGSRAGFEHLTWLAVEGRKIAEAGRREKAMRWLGFLQGALWNCRLANVEDLKNMNRPDESKFDGERV